jgi:hypothetical protein
MLRIITGQAMSGRSSLLIKESSIADQDVTYSSMVRASLARRFAEALALTQPKAFTDDFDLFGLTLSLMSAIRERELAGLETTVVIRKQTSLVLFARLVDQIQIHSWFHCKKTEEDWIYSLREGHDLIHGIAQNIEYAEVP